MSPRLAPVVVPLDPTPASRRLLAEHAERLEHAERVHLVHVVDPETADDVTSRVARARRSLAEMARRTGLPSVTVSVLEGPPGPVVRAYAESVGAAEILVPTPKRPEGRGFVLSPVAEALVHRAPCPVRLLWSRPVAPAAAA